jgi:intraflagellar transport protein 52
MMIIFDASKRETHHPNANFKKLCRRLRSTCKVQVNKESLSSRKLNNCKLLIVGSPQMQFADEELRVIKEFIDKGGSLAVFSSERLTQTFDAVDSLNGLLADFGIAVERTTLVRAAYHRYLHPKHALIQNGIVQPEIGGEKHTPLDTKNGSRRQQQNKNQDDDVEPTMSLSFVYPNGTSLSVKSPAFSLVSSGSTSYPVDCPIMAAWESTSIGDEQGRVLVVGSSDVFADDWLDKEENSQLCDVLFRFLLRRNITFDPSIGRSDFEGTECVPDISSLSNLVKPCLEENTPLPQDYKSMICENLFGVNNDHVPDVIDLYKKLNVPYEPLTLVEPHFECPPPPLRLATHPPGWSILCRLRLSISNSMSVSRAYVFD